MSTWFEIVTTIFWVGFFFVGCVICSYLGDLAHSILEIAHAYTVWVVEREEDAASR